MKKQGILPVCKIDSLELHVETVDFVIAYAII